MTSLTERTKQVFGGAETEVSARIDGLSQAVDAARGRILDENLTSAERVIERASERLQLSGEHTIVALAGATGSGKSSLFNALTDLELAGVGVRRPTTSWALACAWGPDGAEELLEWMGIPSRHQVSRMSMLDRSSDDTKLDGLVLLDLPDHDSTEVSHHVEMDRLVKYADLLVWVLDPQKYADAAIHDRYIKPMAAHVDVTLVVLNQIDRIPFTERENALTDVKRILAREGLPDVPVLGVSATRGDGIDDLKRELAHRIRAKAAAKTRLSVDVGIVAQELADLSGVARVPGISGADREALDRALVDCAGVPLVVDAIRESTSRRARLATGWPLTRWIGKIRRDPLRNLSVETNLSMSALARSSIPEATHIQKASAEVAIRELADKASVGVGDPWARSIREASTSRSVDIVDALDQAIVSTDLGIAQPAAWWSIVKMLQWLFFAMLLVGIGWLLVLAGMGFAQIEPPEPPDVVGLPLPSLLAVAGIVFGIALAVLSQMAARFSGRRKAGRAGRLLREAIGDVAQSHVVAPIETELAAYGRVAEGLQIATK